MSSARRMNSPRRSTGRVHTVEESERERLPMETPQNALSPQPRTDRHPAAFAHSVYERRMNRSKSPTMMSGYGSSASLVATPQRSSANINQHHNSTINAYASSSSFAANNVDNARTDVLTQNEYNSSNANYSMVQTPGGVEYRTPAPGTTAGNSASYGVPFVQPVGNRQGTNDSQQGQLQVRHSTGYVDVPHPTHPHLMPTSDLALTAPDRALLEMLRAEAQDRHFVEKLFVAQEEKHERNQWLSIEGHRRRMMQLAFAAPLRIGRMEAVQERKVGEMIAEFEVGEEVTEHRRRMDDRIADLRDIIHNVNEYRTRLEEQEHDHKTSFDRAMADVESDKRNKKRLLDELTRQYEFATVHSRKDEVIAQQYGRRIMTDDYMRSARRSPPQCTSPISDARVIEKVVETKSSTRFAMSQVNPLLERAPDSHPRYTPDTAKPAIGYNSPGVNASVRLANYNSPSRNLSATPSVRRVPGGGGAQQQNTPASPTPEQPVDCVSNQSLTSDHQGNNNGTNISNNNVDFSVDTDEIIRRGQAAIQRANALEVESASL